LIPAVTPAQSRPTPSSGLQSLAPEVPAERLVKFVLSDLLTDWE
jgi:hypothetical protein